MTKPYIPASESTSQPQTPSQIAHQAGSSSPANPKSPTCTICNTEFHSKSSLNRHTRNSACPRSSKIPTYHCPKCTKAFQRQDTMIRHIKASKDEEHRAYLDDHTSTVCKNCKKDFPDRNRCNKHAARCRSFSGFKMSPLSILEPYSLVETSTSLTDGDLSGQQAHVDLLKTVPNSPLEKTFPLNHDIFTTQAWGGDDLDIGHITGLNHLWESQFWSQDAPSLS